MDNQYQFPNQQQQQQQQQQPHYQRQSQSYYQPNYAHGQPPGKPDNHLAWAILSTIFCCLPLGIVAIVYSAKVDGLYNSGDYVGAYNAANKAQNYALWGTVIGFICILLGVCAGGL